MGAPDFKEGQILVRCDDDQHFTWLYRVSLAFISSSSWPVLAPTRGSHTVDGETFRIEPLARGRDAPRRCWNDFFLFNPRPVREFSEAFARAKELADFADEDTELDDTEAWIISGLSHLRFGEQVGQGILEGAMFDGVKDKFARFLVFWVAQGVWVMLISMPVLFVNAAPWGCGTACCWRVSPAASRRRWWRTCRRLCG
ncbi:unnamed protein product [Prorocentrum cordatum]|uniref:Autophagy-related protein 9 n=1 Tax=Prorocentrum cordatum TaxID=2364126 RepID=A0ABN9PJG0_9DINO|nr:unnamed protein product [Polarella glacialis]